MSENEQMLDVQAELPGRLERYEGMSLLEQYAMYMGKAQLLEFGLKKLMESRSGKNLESMEKWTLGKTKNELADLKTIRSDFLTLLGGVVDQRNHIAHSLLANYALIASLTGGDPGTKESRFLGKAIFELEQLILFFDWCNEHDAWSGDGS